MRGFLRNLTGHLGELLRFRLDLGQIVGLERLLGGRDGVLEFLAFGLVELLGKLEGAGLDFIKTDHLYRFDGERAWSLGQGEKE